MVDLPGTTLLKKKNPEASFSGIYCFTSRSGSPHPPCWSVDWLGHAFTGGLGCCEFVIAVVWSSSGGLVLLWSSGRSGGRRCIELCPCLWLTDTCSLHFDQSNFCSNCYPLDGEDSLMWSRSCTDTWAQWRAFGCQFGICPFSTLKAVGSPLGLMSAPIMGSWPDLKYPGMSFFLWSRP